MALTPDKYQIISFGNFDGLFVATKFWLSHIYLWGHVFKYLYPNLPMIIGYRFKKIVCQGKVFLIYIDF